MKVYKKNYIGKGTQVPNMQIIRVSLNLARIQEYKHEYEGEEYISFEVAKMQNPDNYGRTHTVYCTTSEEVIDEKPVKKTRKTKVAEKTPRPF